MNMKKLLITAIVTAFSMAGFSQGIGEYAYTAQGKVIIIDDANMVQNGRFENGSSGWTTDGGNELSTDTFVVQTGMGPNGSDCLITLEKQNGPKSGSTLLQKVKVFWGETYYVSYYVKTEEDYTSTTTSSATAKNYQNVFFNASGVLFNASGSLNQEVGIATPVSTEAGKWTKVEYSFTAPSNGYVYFYMYAPYVGQCFGNFSILRAHIVPDDREAARIVARLREYADAPWLSSAKDHFEEMIGEINSAVENDNYEEFSAVKAALDGEIIPGILDEYFLDVSNLLSCPHFNEATVGSAAAENNRAKGWTFVWDNPDGTQKSRWVVKEATYTEPYATRYLSRATAGNLELSDSKLSQSLNLPKGRYMYSMRLNARRFTNKNNNVIDSSRDIRNLFVFMGTDTTECLSPDTTDMKRYVVFHNHEADGPVEVGFHMASPSCHELSLDLTEVRSLDNSYEEIEAYLNMVKFNDARDALSAQITEARALLGSEDYVFGKAALADSISVSEAVYNETVENSAENMERLGDYTNILRRACSYYKAMNVEYIALADAIREGSVLMEDGSVTGDKSQLRTALSEGQGYYASLTVESTRDSLQLMAYAEAIGDAITILKMQQLEADEMYSFYQWSMAEWAAYSSMLDRNAETVSAGSVWNTVYRENADFAGHALNGRLGINSVASTALVAGKGMTVTSAKNKLHFSVLDLKEGNVVTIDWALSTGTLYVGSGNASYVKDDGTVATFTKKGDASDIKVADNVIDSQNADGINATHRTVLTMTADGTLDFFVGSASTTTIAYIGIDYEDPATGVSYVGDAAGLGDDRVLNILGQRVSRNAKGIIIRNGKKYINR